jgi:hypothetical protein
MQEAGRRYEARQSPRRPPSQLVPAAHEQVLSPKLLPPRHLRLGQGARGPRPGAAGRHVGGAGRCRSTQLARIHRPPTHWQLQTSSLGHALQENLNKGQAASTHARARVRPRNVLVLVRPDPPHLRLPSPSRPTASRLESRAQRRLRDLQHSPHDRARIVVGFDTPATRLYQPSARARHPHSRTRGLTPRLLAGSLMLQSAMLQSQSTLLLPTLRFAPQIPLTGAPSKALPRGPSQPTYLHTTCLLPPLPHPPLSSLRGAAPAGDPKGGRLPRGAG